MRIDLDSLAAVLDQLESAMREIETTAVDVRSEVGGHFSAISGFNETGLIHSRAVRHDPASAQEQLRMYAEQVGWAANLLAAETRTVSSQDSSNAHGLELADTGGAVTATSEALPEQPNFQSTPLSYVPPIVVPGASLLRLVNDFNATNFGLVGQIAADWGTMSSNIQRVVGQLNSAATTLESDNESDFTSNTASKIREIAGTGEQFVANASLMQERTAGIVLNAPWLAMEMPGDLTIVKAIPEPAAQKTAEAAMLAKWQVKLQQLVTNSLPNQQSLTDPPTSHGSGDNVDIGLETIAGTGIRYSTDEVVWPQEIQDAVNSGEIGPGSFGVADGELVALENIDQGLVEQVREAINDRNETLYGGGRLQEYINGGMQSLEEAATQAAGIDGATGGAFNSGANPGLGQASTANAGPGLGGLGTGVGAGAMGPIGGIGGAGGLGSAGGGSAASGIRGGIPAAGLSGARGVGVGSLGGRAFSAAGGDGVARVLGGGGENAARAGASAGAGVGTNGAGAGAHGSGVNGQNGRGMGPMMAPGAAGRNQDKKKSGMIKAVTSRVEADKNRRDLLGDPPAALPGPIGDWARQ